MKIQFIFNASLHSYIGKKYYILQQFMSWNCIFWIINCQEPDLWIAFFVWVTLGRPFNSTWGRGGRYNIVIPSKIFPHTDEHVTRSPFLSILLSFFQKLNIIYVCSVCGLEYFRFSWPLFVTEQLYNKIIQILKDWLQFESPGNDPRL